MVARLPPPSVLLAFSPLVRTVAEQNRAFKAGNERIGSSGTYPNTKTATAYAVAVQWPN